MIPVADQYVGSVKCCSCEHVQETRGQLQAWREGMERRLAELQSQGREYVHWLTAKDEHVCPRCRERDGRLFTIDQVRQIIRKRFCRAKDRWQGCRCIIIPALPPVDASRKPKGESPFRVVSDIKTEVRDGEVVKVIQFDLKIDKDKLAKWQDGHEKKRT